MLLALCVGCKRIDVDFNYSPTTPRAGEVVAFSNLCTAGEKWAWSFGDNTTSLAKNPNHIYKKPGTYMVTLMVDSAKYQTCSKSITVYDTVPTFVISTDSILHYQNAVFTANVYNPFGHSLTYEWTVSSNYELLSTSTNQSRIAGYFKSPTESDSISLLITLNGKEFKTTKHFTVHLTQAPAIITQLADNSILRQRIIQDRIEDCVPALAEDHTLIQNTNDTVVTFNGTTFYASKLSTSVAGFAGLDIRHMQLDPMVQKWYITTSEGLFVANFDGSSRVAIDTTATGAVCIDTERNRIYWASTTGLYAMPLIKSKNNSFTSQAAQYNTHTNISLIAIDNQNR